MDELRHTAHYRRCLKGASQERIENIVAHSCFPVKMALGLGRMPWTPREKRFLLSASSPLSDAQKQKMKGELHANPKLGHARKGSKALKKVK